MQVPSPNVHKYSFSDLPVQVSGLERLMGYKEGETPEAIHDAIKDIFDEAAKYTDIQGGYVLIEEFDLKDKNKLLVGGLEFHSGRTITGILRKSDKLAFSLMTAGGGIENWSREMMRDGDPLAGYIIDMLGSEIVEAGMDLMQGELEKQMGKQGFRISNRYSPGHCGWLVEEQQKLFTLFPENFGGITLSESSLMIPIKSVSSVIGIGPDMKKLEYNCQVCDMENCFYRDRKILV